MTTITLPPQATETRTPYISITSTGGTSDARGIYSGPAVSPNSSAVTRQIADPLREQFRALADWWHEATDALSSPDEKAEHEAYQRIVSLGRPALRYILEDLRDHGGHWFMALEEITHMEPPIPAGVTPSLRAERDAWLSWGRATCVLD
jgi:hypothetical protein